MSRLSYRNLIKNPPAATPAPIPNTVRTIGLVSMLIKPNRPPSPIPNKPLFFLVLWFLFYLVTYLMAKIITGVFKLSGINFLIRVIGGLLNCTKAVLIVVVVLTFMSTLNIRLYDETNLTKYCVCFGSKALVVFKKNIDENQIDLKKVPEIDKDSYIMDDDFRYNLLER